MELYNKLKRYLGNKKGFSLIEVLVAVTISSVVITMIYGAQRTIIFSIQKMTGVADFYENVNLTIRRINKDLSSCLYNRKNRRLFFIGENSQNEINEGKIHFVTINHNDFNTLGVTNKEFRSSDIKEVSYYLEKDEAYKDFFLLKRREANQYDDKHDKGGVSSVILTNVVDIKFEFKYDSSWDKTWSSRLTYKFPKLVKTTLTVMNYQNKEETFIFISRLNMVK